MESQGDLFDRLSEELTVSIFQRLLWSPSSYEPKKAHQRLQLEAVSKTFRALVSKTGCLEWKIGCIEDERNFLRYMSGDVSRRSLTKVALYLDRPVDLTAILQSFIPLSLDTLEEIQLIFWGLDDEDEPIDCESIFHSLQECKRLVAFRIFLWDCEREGPDCLKFSMLPKPFAALQTLVVPELAVSVETLSSILPSFPVLETLELHSVHGKQGELRSSSLKEVFLWHGRHLKVPLKGPRRVGVPRDLEKVVGLLYSGDDVKELTGSYILLNLLGSLAAKEDPRAQIQQAVLRFPGCLQKVVTFLSRQDVAFRNRALWILERLALVNGHEVPIATAPGCIQGLAHALADRELESLSSVPSIISCLADDIQARTLLLNAPEILQGLVSLLDDVDPEVQLAVGDALAKLTSQSEGAEALSSTPQSLEKLVGLLDSGNAKLQGQGAHCLCSLAYAMSEDKVENMLRVPGCVEKLVGLLWSESLETRERSALALARLAECALFREMMPAVPQLLQRLLDFLEPNEGASSQLLREASVRILGNVDLDAKQMKLYTGRRALVNAN
ncbi:hypothetical protein KFL_007590090 [Klebsormidium nitens]|uniref:Vacuolar protein 8 n=1 Tax=Klebsormidium nitens TaxID=105231 RepID=A0A1Y1IK96_KLENI|nr:hypothetical protein KFL_007590090 [Klebsormidium nitens]|eukprot:GAQ91295.1 hypothetical protein KFL_007590090 [Klebsormidium nitens]